MEDYLTNQQVVLRHLIKAGCEVDLAENGEEGIEKFRAHHYDLILMDIQMPIMDGFEATKAIRQIELEEGRKRVPIIAMTAHAIAGYANKCIEGGMDDYIAKPIRKGNLLKMIAKWTESKSQAVSEEKHEGLNAVNEPLNLNQLLRDFDEDRDNVLRILKGFIATTEKQIPVIEKAINEQDLNTLRRHAHSIKGGALNLTARALADAAYKIEIIE